MFVISYANGYPERSYDTYEEAQAAVRAEFGDDVAIGHDGDLDGFGDRTLFWASEEDAENDDGARALGDIRYVRS
jgi:predicted NUDIX family NTP pyrophosphohydrolase